MLNTTFIDIQTSNAKLWQSLAERMKLALPDQSRTFPVGHFLRNQYARWVLPFEIYCGRYADGQEVTVTLSVAKEDEEVGNDAHEDDCCASDDDECPEGQDEQPATTSTTTTRRSGRPRAVPKHYVDNQEPLIVRRRKTGRAATHRKRGLSTAAASSSTVSYYAFIDRVASLTAPPPAPTYRAPSTRPPSYVPGELCELCYDDTVCGASILLCDGCDLGYHPTCLPVPLDAIPDGDWFCPRCMAADDNFGFEEGGEYTLEEFRRKANAFKTQHFAARKGLVVDGAIVGEVVVSEEEMEREFWRLSSSTFEALEVDYGADLHSSVTGR